MIKFSVSAKVKSINPALSVVDSKGFQLLVKEYNAIDYKTALKGFTEYLEHNRSFTEYKEITIK